jgi:flagellar M-ring protein FliF
MERRLETRAQSLLDRALGAGNSLVRVNAEIDFDQRERVEEAIDPNGAVVVSEHVSTEKGSAEIAGGVPGVVSNLQSDGSSIATTTTTPSSRSEEVVNYEMSKIVSKTVQSVGTIKALSVSVLVADKLTPGAEGAKPTPTPRNAEEIKEIEKMVRTALGINNNRGDLISVVSMPFESGFEEEPMPQPSLIDKIYPFMPLIKYALLGIAALLAYLLFLRPLLRTLRSASDQTSPMKTVEELEAELRDQSDKPLLGGPSDPLAQIRQEVLGGDMMPVQVVKNWLREEPSES